MSDGTFGSTGVAFAGRPSPGHGPAISCIFDAAHTQRMLESARVMKRFTGRPSLDMLSPWMSILSKKGLSMDSRQESHYFSQYEAACAYAKDVAKKSGTPALTVRQGDGWNVNHSPIYGLNRDGYSSFRNYGYSQYSNYRDRWNEPEQRETAEEQKARIESLNERALAAVDEKIRREITNKKSRVIPDCCEACGRPLDFCRCG